MQGSAVLLEELSAQIEEEEAEVTAVDSDLRKASDACAKALADGHKELEVFWQGRAEHREQVKDVLEESVDTLRQVLTTLCKLSTLFAGCIVNKGDCCWNLQELPAKF